MLFLLFCSSVFCSAEATTLERRSFTLPGNTFNLPFQISSGTIDDLIRLNRDVRDVRDLPNYRVRLSGENAKSVASFKGTLCLFLAELYREIARLENRQSR